MNQQVQKQPDYNKDVELIETVRSTIFPGSTDSELRLFMFKCQSIGVHPLEKLLIPVKFDGKISFISTIDLLRSMSEDAGDYAGIDPIEFIGESSFEFGDKTIFHPDEAICRVYRSGIDRPFEGHARWNEFYPGDKKGFKWREMPTIMLGKCAEAQARRLAWPKKLNQLYTPEEMEQGFEAIADGYTSKKPDVSPSDIHVTDAPKTVYSEDVKSLRKPTDEERKKGCLISEKQGFLMYGTCKDAGVEIGAVAAAAQVENIFFLTWKKNSKVNFNVMLESVKNFPNKFHKYSQAAATAKEAVKKNNPPEDAPVVMDQEEFVTTVEALALQAGITVADGLRDGFGIDTLEDVLPELQEKVITWFSDNYEQPKA